MPCLKLCEQVDPQSIPAGVLVTVPVPVPAPWTVRVYVTATLKVAVTVCSAPTCTWQLAVPEQPPPDQPPKVDPGRVWPSGSTTVPVLKLCEQVAPQAIPAGVLVTVPVPVPALLTVRVRITGALKVAVTVWSLPIVTSQVPVPEQPPPDQPMKVDPEAGVAFSVTTVPCLKVASRSRRN